VAGDDPKGLERRAHGLTLGSALDARGRASRARVDGSSRELWRLEASDDRVVRRLLRLAESGIGGFVDAGLDDEGIWLLRAVPDKTLESLRRDASGPWPHERAVSMALAIAEALAACEAASLFPGAVTSATVCASESGEVQLPADSLVGAMVGEPGAVRGGTDTGPKALLWSPPEKLDDALWDASSNRYALGVLLYDLLAGQHPFGGAGLRHALREARQDEAAPFARDVARKLPPGLQSTCLKLIARDPAERPASAAAIAEALGAIAAGRVAEGPAAEEVVHIVAPPQKRARIEPAPPPRERFDLSWLGARLSRGKLATVPVVVGLVVFGIAMSFALDGPEKAATGPKPKTGSMSSLSAAETLAKDCASCHPRHAAEWSQSVMGHSVKSPLFNALEALIEEQVGRDRDCPNGAGILRRADPSTACRSRQTGLTVTGSGGEHWCVNCHAAGDNLGSRMPAWQGRPGGDPRSRHPVKDLIGEVALEGISCGFCHQVHGPVGPNGSPGYQGNPTWRSFVTGTVFASRPEDRRGRFGIANSGYLLDPAELLLGGRDLPPDRLALTPTGFAVHARPSESAKRYLASSDFCGSCHDVRLFGTDVIGGRRGEHFKRLRNAYSEWAAWADDERVAGREPASCQDCHMSTYPGVCVTGERDTDPIHDGCPDGMRFEPHEPGRRVPGRVAQTSGEATALTPHYLAGVDMPLALEIADEALDQDGLDAAGTPLSAKRRRDLLLRASMELTLGEARRVGGELEIPVRVENVGAGHKVPAGFSQEREIWVHLRVEDGSGGLVYEVGRVDRNDEDLHDKIFLRVNTDPDRLDGLGQPTGLFGADVRDGPDVPTWSPPPELGGDRFRGRGLVNFQNGFLRCVRCIGVISPNGECEVSAFDHRAARLDDGDYDIDTGECRSNLFGQAALLETYFPVGALDADRGAVKGPDAIIDTRSLNPGRRVEYTYALPTRGRPGPFKVSAELMFRSFPPYLVRAFAEYEQKQAARGRRPSGPLVTFEMMKRLERVLVDRATLVIP
jgi:eukaryotic-like serine/threonine-protein kinase